MHHPLSLTDISALQHILHQLICCSPPSSWQERPRMCAWLESSGHSRAWRCGSERTAFELEQFRRYHHTTSTDNLSCSAHSSTPLRSYLHVATRLTDRLTDCYSNARQARRANECDSFWLLAFALGFPRTNCGELVIRKNTCLLFSMNSCSVHITRSSVCYGTAA